MPIDPSIPLQAKNVQFESPVNQLVMLSEATKLGEMNRNIEEQNRLNEYLKGADLTNPAARTELMKYGKTGLAYGKALAEQEKLGMETKKLGYETKGKQLDVQREQFANLVFNPSDANITAHLQDSVLKGELPEAQAGQMLQKVMGMNLDQRKQFFTDMGMKAAERAQLEETRRSHKVNEGIAGGHLQIAREARGDVGQTLTDSAGNVTLLDKQGNVIKQLGPVGKPSATFEKTAALQKQHGRDLDMAITEISNAIKPGGILEKSTASGAGKLRDAAGNFIGYATEGSINAASLKPIADLGLKMVPRFEGPQSDKDTASYKEAAGQLANENLPVATRRAAAETVVRLMKARKGQFVNEAMANEGIGAAGVDTSNPLLAK